MAMIRALLCKLPRWMGGGHRWRRLTKKECESPGLQVMVGALDGSTVQLRICRRCGAKRIVKSRKKEVTK